MRVGRLRFFFIRMAEWHGRDLRRLASIGDRIDDLPVFVSDLHSVEDGVLNFLPELKLRQSVSLKNTLFPERAAPFNSEHSLALFVRLTKRHVPANRV